MCNFEEKANKSKTQRTSRYNATNKKGKDSFECQRLKKQKTIKNTQTCILTRLNMQRKLNYMERNLQICHKYESIRGICEIKHRQVFPEDNTFEAITICNQSAQYQESSKQNKKFRNSSDQLQIL